MTTYGDFSSLLQLGVGIGIGLSLFRAPIDLRVSRIQRRLDGEIAALAGSSMPFAKQKRRDMQDLKFRFTTIRADLDRRQLPFMIIAVLGAVLNLAGLVMATLEGDRPVGTVELWILLFISVAWFLLLLAALEILARKALRDVQRDLSALQARRAPPIDTAGEGNP